MRNSAALLAAPPGAKAAASLPHSKALRANAGLKFCVWNVIAVG